MEQCLQISGGSPSESLFLKSLNRGPFHTLATPSEAALPMWLRSGVPTFGQGIIFPLLLTNASRHGQSQSFLPFPFLPVKRCTQSFFFSFFNLLYFILLFVAFFVFV